MKCKYCNNEAIFPPKTKWSGWCCSESFYKCPGYKLKLSENHNSWNKGLTKENNLIIFQMAIKAKGKRVGGIKQHTDESKLKIALSMKGNTNGNHRGDRQSYYNGIRMDSSWEVKVAEYLDKQGIKWTYGQLVLAINEIQSYRPDFVLENGTVIEVKGYWRKENKDKFEKCKILYPDIQFEVWDKIKLKELNLI